MRDLPVWVLEVIAHLSTHARDDSVSHRVRTDLPRKVNLHSRVDGHHFGVSRNVSGVIDVVSPQECYGRIIMNVIKECL